MSASSTPARGARRSAAQAARQAANSPEAVVPEVAEVTPLPESEKPNPNLSSRVVARPDAPKRTTLAMADNEDLTRKIDQSDLVMPKLRISQAMSKVNAQFSETRGKSGVGMGAWYNTNDSKDLGDVVYFVPLDMQKSRGMFVLGKGLVCRSFDLKQGVGDPGIPCEGTFEEIHTMPAEERGCSYRLWTHEDGRNIKPPCGLAYNYPGVLLTEEPSADTKNMTTVMLSIRSAATPAAKKLNTIVMSQGQGRWTNVVIELTVGKRNGPAGEYFIPEVEFFDLTEAEEYARIKRYAEATARRLNPRAVAATLESDDLDD
jgi:hypothetical protein